MTYEDAFQKLSNSKFRSRFSLDDHDREYVLNHGMEELRMHAAKIVGERLAPSHPLNDGHQTPMRGHPVFKAQHATATCCRGCLCKWWHVAKSVPLNEEQQAKIVEFILAWIARQMSR